jgi:hypothetical protein
VNSHLVSKPKITEVLGWADRGGCVWQVEMAASRVEERIGNKNPKIFWKFCD